MAMRWAARHVSLRLESSGASALAAVVTHEHRFDAPVGIVLSGGNISRERFLRLQASPARRPALTDASSH